MARIVITIKDDGVDRVKITTNPPLDKLMRMVRDIREGRQFTAAEGYMIECIAAIGRKHKEIAQAMEQEVFVKGKTPGELEGSGGLRIAH